MICGCGALIKAIDAYIEKADGDLEDTLDEAGFIDAEDTVKEIATLEDRVARALKKETKYIIDAAEQADNLTAFAAAWDENRLGDTIDEKLRKIFLEEFTTIIPKLTAGYIALSDPELAAASVTKAVNVQIDNEAAVADITKRTTAWAESWSTELSGLMKLTSHEEIQKILVTGLREGQGVAEFTKAILDSGIRDEYYKARRVAITETLTAHSVAQQESFIQSPAVEEKEWIHTGSYRNTPRENHVAMSGQRVPTAAVFRLEGADGIIYYPLYPRDASELPPGERVNCHCISQPIVSEDILGLSIEERRELQAQAIANDDAAWEKELDAQNRAKAGIEEVPDNIAPYTKPEKDDIISISDYGHTDTVDRRPGDSLSLFTDAQGNLTAEREALHRSIINETFSGVTPADGQATFTMMGGGSASGKSTMINGGAVTLPTNAVMLDSDAIKTKLPEYINMVAAGDDLAAPFVHEESSALAKRMLGIANSGNYNVTLDGTGDGSIASLTKKIMDAKDAGMTVKGVYATVPTETALERSILRAAKTGRKVPVDAIIEIHSKVSEVLPQCASLFDAVELYDTTNEALLIATGGNGRGLTAVPGQESLFEAFLAKATVDK